MTVDPVFVDRSGRRRRPIVAAGIAGGLVLLTAVVALLAGLTGAGSAAAPGWPRSPVAGATPHRDVVTSGRPAAPRATTTAPPVTTPTITPAGRVITASASPTVTGSASVTPSASAKNRGRGPSVRASKRS